MNPELEFLQNLFGSADQAINLLSFFVQLVLTALLSMVVGYVYVRFGHALSNRRALARTFVLVSVTTMLIITIVKSSLALSLGLVGALSIVRFRTAIKEPEELAFFFMVIGIGLGIGAGQVMVTVLGTAGLCLLVVLVNRKKMEDLSQNLIINLKSEGNGDQVKQAISILEKHCSQLELRRLDEQGEQTEIAFVVSFENHSALLAAKDGLKEKYPTASFSFLELV